VSARLKRTHSWQETHANVRRARELAERYGLDEAHPADYIDANHHTPSDWDNLLNQIK
jgi:hypothetical protein